jgi:predicted nucleotidyltransferase
VKLVSLTPEGKIALTLKHGKHTYNELKFETELSDRWLTVKLEELKNEGVIKKSGKWYDLAGSLDISAYELSLYMSLQAKRMANELAKLPFVKMIVLFGGVAQKRAEELSDLDMIIVVDEQAEKAKIEITPEISKLEMKYHVMIEPLVLTEEDFLDNIYSDSGIIYGVAEGFEVIIDKTGKLAKTLRNKIIEIKRSYEYLKEARIWVKAKSKFC